MITLLLSLIPRIAAVWETGAYVARNINLGSRLS
jgi:hypothetical protein